MFVVDAQVHIWEDETPEHPWIEGGHAFAHMPTPLSGEFLLSEMDRVGVDRALLVCPSWEGPRNDLVRDVSAAHPDRFRAIGRFRMNDLASADLLEEWAADPLFIGVRTAFNRATREFLHDGTADWIWPVVERLGLNVFVFAPRQYAETAAVIERNPGIRFTIDHLGMDVGVHDGSISSFIDDVLTFAKFPNVAVKATSLPSFVSAVDTFPFPTLHDYIRRVVEAFGPERVFWGSDLSRLDCTYDELRDMFLYHLDFLNEAELQSIMGEGVCNWLGWPIP